MSYLNKHVRASVAFLRSRTFIIGLFALVMAYVIGHSTMTNAVYVVEDGVRSLRFTAEDSPEMLLEAYAPSPNGPGEQLSVDFEGISGHFAQINISRDLRATISADGYELADFVPRGTTVGELLYQKGIQYDGNDLLNHPPERTVEDGDLITLKRVEYEEYTITEPIAYTTIRKNSPLVQVGAVKEVQVGKPGKRVKTYVQRTVDDVREEVQLLGEHIASRPVSETLLIGSVQPVSPYDFDLAVDEHGKPLHYKRLLTNQITTGYSARPGAKTASGRDAIVGNVAVNPNVIPYGSKLYITSSDGSFVYGCAIAADTGTGLLANIVQIDLFYETYIESAMNGRKYLDVYVLE